MSLVDDLQSPFPLYYKRVAFQGETKREKTEILLAQIHYHTIRFTTFDNYRIILYT